MTLEETVEGIVARFDGVEKRRMFASNGWFTRGSLFVFLAQKGRVVLRLPDTKAQDELLALDGATMWRIGDKAPMRAWIAVPEAMHDDRRALGAWLKRGWSLAPEAKKKTQRRK
jgi:TfoX/Sxy family transcriptional regulator of competence genes